MDNKEYINLDFRPIRRIPHRIIWIVGLVIVQVVLWQFIPSLILRWLLIPVIGILGWAASFGWREALRALRFWLDQVIGDELR